MYMAKQKKGCFLRTLIGIAAVVVVIGIIAAMGSDGDSEGPEKITANPGETVTTEKLDLSVQKLELTETVGGDFLESSASEGGMYVALKYKYKNITNVKGAPTPGKREE
jgi:hypothetical protein